MEEEDKRSLVSNEPRQLYNPKAANAGRPEIVFACSDIRYQNKPIEGYIVMPSSNGMDRQSENVSQAPVTGRPLLGQGRRQEPNNTSPKNEIPPRPSIPGLIQLPQGPPPISQSRQSPRRSDAPYPSGTHSSSYDRNMTRQHHESREVASRSYRQVGPQRSLFDPANPHKPIMVASRDDVTNQPIPVGCPEMSFQSLPADQGNTSSRPTWYDPQSER